MEEKRSAVQDHVQSHIEMIAGHEQDFLERRTRLERVGDAIGAFAGGLRFVGLHLIVFAGWVLVNTAGVGGIAHFDPYPFSLLGTAVSIEALMLASFILMRQGRVAKRSDERDHLILQVLLLSEREITASLRIQRQLAARLGMEQVANDKDTEALSQHTSIEDVAQTIKESLSGDQ
jgi:uncharacterized membrane protein